MDFDPRNPPPEIRSRIELWNKKTRTRGGPNACPCGRADFRLTVHRMACPVWRAWVYYELWKDK